MSSPFSQHNQQPFQPQQGMGGYPQQGGYPQGGNQQGGYQQQPAQPSYGATPYGQPAYAGGPMGPQPSGSNSGKLIAIIAGSFVAALVIGGIIMMIFQMSMSTSQEDRSARPAPTSTSSPTYGSNPTSKPSSSPTYGSKPSPTYGSKPSPTSGSGTGTGSSSGSNGGSDPAVENMIQSTCDSQINTAIKGASITNKQIFLINTSSDKFTYAYTGHVTGRLAKNNEAVDSDFTCKADYDLSTGLIETHFE